MVSKKVLKILDKRKKHIFPYCEEDWNNKFKSLEKQAKVSLKALEMAREEGARQELMNHYYKINLVKKVEARVRLETINKVKFKVEEASLFYLLNGIIQ